VFAAVAVVLGGVVAATARDGRIVVLGLMLAAVTASLVASPLPSSLAITARILGAILAAYVLWVAIGPGPVDSAGSAIGPLAETAVAVAAFSIGLAIKPVDPLAGPIAGQAAGLALIVLAVVPLAGRDVFRMGIGVTLLTLGCSLLVEAWSGPTLPLEQLTMAALLVGIAGATSLLMPSVEELEAAALGAEAGEETARSADSVERLAAAADSPAANIPAPARRPRFDVTVGRRAATGPQSPTGLVEPPRRPRPMTADPIEPDDWLAWEQAEPETSNEGALRRFRKAPAPDQSQPKKPAPKKPTSRRPNLHGKP